MACFVLSSSGWNIPRLILSLCKSLVQIGSAFLLSTRRRVAQTERCVVFALTVACTLMYHRGVRFFLFPGENYGRLLKLVDRTDLGSVGASRESSSLSPPTLIKIILPSILPI